MCGEGGGREGERGREREREREFEAGRVGELGGPDLSKCKRVNVSATCLVYLRDGSAKLLDILSK